MSRTVSFRDLMLCTKLKGVTNEIELLHTKYDAVMEEILSEIGFDTDYPVVYVPSKHRDMQNRVAVGFQAIGEISLNRRFVNSPLFNMIDRMVAASYSDPSLTRELSALTGNQVNFKSLFDSEGDADGEELPDEMLEPDRHYVAEQIRVLAEIRDSIRGSMYNEAGDLKTFSEYK